jgi:DNA-binding MarR family transcriptional regulator
MTLGLVDAMAQLTFVVYGVLARIAAANDLSIIQIRLLGLLRDRRPTITELAVLLQLDKSSVTGLVDRAEERGLVQRVASTVDGRSVHVSITPFGRELIDRGSSAFEGEIVELVGGLTTAERARLAVLATRIVATDAQRRGIDVLTVDPTLEQGTKAHRR